MYGASSYGSSEYGGLEVRRARIIQKAHKYTVLATPSAITKAHQYAVITTPAAITKSHAYSVKKTTAITKQHQYDVLAAFSITKTHTYAVKAASTITKAHKYEIDVTPSAITKAHQYAVITTPAAITKSHAYDVFLYPVSITKTHAYAVLYPTTISLSSRYTVKATKSAITKQHQYAVIAPVQDDEDFSKEIIVSKHQATSYILWNNISVSANAYTSTLPISTASSIGFYISVSAATVIDIQAQTPDSIDGSGWTTYQTYTFDAAGSISFGIWFLPFTIMRLLTESAVTITAEIILRT